MKWCVSSWLLGLAACTFNSTQTLPQSDTGPSQDSTAEDTSDTQTSAESASSGQTASSSAGSTGLSDESDTPAASDSGTPAEVWAAKRMISVTVPDSLTDVDERSVPVLLRLNASRVEYDEMAADGRDLQFWDAAEQTVLPHEIELWNPSGTSYVWVQLTEVTSSGDSFWMYYGHPTHDGPVAATSVWDPNHAGVWHFSDEASGAIDSTIHSNDALASGPVTVETEGVIAGAKSFHNDSPALDVNDSQSLDISTALTVEAWLRLDTTDVGENRSIIQKSGAYQFRANAVPTLYVNVGGEWENAGSGEPLLTDSWHYLAASYDRDSSSIRLYLDGQLVRQRQFGLGDEPISQTDGLLAIGNLLEGTVDELRLSSVARSDDWIALQYHSVTENLLSYGPALTP